MKRIILFVSIVAILFSVCFTNNGCVCADDYDLYGSTEDYKVVVLEEYELKPASLPYLIDYDTFGYSHFGLANMPTFDTSNIKIFDPSNIPTFDPTNIPTFDQSNIPTFDPSNIPTFDPSNIPTFDPSNIPALDTSKISSIDLIDPSISKYDPSNYPIRVTLANTEPIPIKVPIDWSKYNKLPEPYFYNKLDLYWPYLSITDYIMDTPSTNINDLYFEKFAERITQLSFETGSWEVALTDKGVTLRKDLGKRIDVIISFDPAFWKHVDYRGSFVIRYIW